MAGETTTGRLLTELEHMDEREAQINAALLRRLKALEQRDLGSRSVRVADLHTLKTALDDLRATVAAVQAQAVAPATGTNGDGTAPSVPPTFEDLQAQLHASGAATRRMRGLLVERLRTLTPPHGDGSHTEHHEPGAARPRPRRARPASPARPAPHRTAKANGHASAHAGGVAAAIRAHGGHYEDDIVREAQRFRVPAALVCAVIEVESSFRNVFGHDTVRNPIKSPPGGVRAVTEENYRAYVRHRKLGEGSQGVGPMQLTHFSLQDEADALGGCFRTEVNIHVGVKHVASLIAADGLQRGVQRYNGAPGHTYADEVLKRKRAWDARLAGAHAASPHKATVASPGRPGPAAAQRTFKLRRTPMQGADVRRFQRELNHRFAGWGIARQIPEDGVYGAQTQRAAHQVAIALGLAAAAYEHGVTPRLRVLIRTPSRRSALELRRAKARRDYRAKLRRRYGRLRPGGAAAAGGSLAAGASPKAVIDEIVIPIARRNGIGVTPRSVEQANHAHSLNTTSGNRSDHKGPPDVAWAADMSNGGSPTPQMDKLAADLARTFGISWPGSGLVNHTDGRYRYQLIYRTNVGGNHFNHVHLGVKKL